jgi:hypothetical protein
VSIRYVDYANELIPVVSLGNEELIPLPYVYQILGLERHTVYEHLDNLIVDSIQIPIEMARQIRQQEGSSLRGRPPHGITKDQFKKLVKVVNTPEAWNVYDAIWGMAENHARAIQNDMPEWAARFTAEVKRDVSNISEGQQRLENVCRGLRDEVDELTALVSVFCSDQDKEEVRELIKVVAEELGMDKRAVVGHARKTLNLCSVYNALDMRVVKNVLKNMIGQGLRVVKEDNPN